MIVQLNKVYKENGDYFIIEQELNHINDDPMVSRLIDRKFSNLINSLRAIFNTQGDLYNAISTDNKYITLRYDATSSYFSKDNQGWRNFCNYVTNRELQTLTDLYTDEILEKIDYISTQFRKQTHSTVKTGLVTDTETVELSQLQFNTPMMVISNDQAYEMNLKAVPNIKSLDDLQTDIFNSIKDDTIRQTEVKLNNAEKKNKQLRDKLKTRENKMFIDVLCNADEILGNWEFFNDGVDLWLKYKNEIVTNKVNYNGRLYDYNQEVFNNPDDYEKLYIQGLRIKVKEFIVGGDVKSTRGKNLHFSGTTTTSACIGDLNGKPFIEVMRELPRELEIANLGSPLNTKVRQYLTEKFIPNIQGQQADSGLDTNAWVIPQRRR
jgi:hypothetical protein